MLGLEFDDVSGVMRRSDSFNVNGFDFGEILWRSIKLQLGDGAASSSDENVICLLFRGWPR